MLTGEHLEHVSKGGFTVESSPMGRSRTDDALQDSLRAQVLAFVERGAMKRADLARHLGRDRQWMTEFLKGKKRANPADVERLRSIVQMELRTGSRLDQHSRKDGAVMADPPRDSGFVELIRAYARKVEDLKPLDEEQEWFEQQVAEALRELRRRRRFAPDVEGQQKVEQS